MFNFKLHSFSLGNFILQHQNINFKYLTWRRKGTLFYNALFYSRKGKRHKTRQCNKRKRGISDKKRPKMGLFFSYMPKRDLKLLVSPLSIRGMSL